MNHLVVESAFKHLLPLLQRSLLLRRESTAAISAALPVASQLTVVFRQISHILRTDLFPVNLNLLAQALVPQVFFSRIVFALKDGVRILHFAHRSRMLFFSFLYLL